MSQSLNSNKNHKVSLNKDALPLIKLDSSRIIKGIVQSKKDMTQNWINNIFSEIKLEEIESVQSKKSLDLEKLQDSVNKLILPSTEIINNMSLNETLAYETMLINIVDTIPSNISSSVKILLHLKIITNNQIHKFRIFE